MRAEVDPVTGDLTPAAIAARRSSGGGTPPGTGGGSGGGAPTSLGAGGSGGTISGTGTSGTGGGSNHVLPPPMRAVDYARGTKRGHGGSPTTYDEVLHVGDEGYVANVHAWRDGATDA
jgi:hypothetical protein